MGSQLQTQLSGIARSGTLNVLGAAAAAVLNFGFVVVVTRLFDQGTAGSLFSATSIFLIALSICSLGTDAGLSRFLLRFQALGRAQDMPTVIAVARTPVLLCSVLVALLGSIFSAPIATMIGLESSDAPLIIIILVAILPIAALGDFSLASARALGSFRSTVLADKLLRPVLQPAGALLVSAVGGGLLWLSCSWAIPYVFASALSIMLFRRVFKKYRNAPGTGHTSVPQVRREYWTFTWPRAVARISQSVIQRADIVIVAALVGPVEAAIYTAATRFVALGQFGIQAIQQVLQPRFSQLIARKQHQTLEQVFKTSTSWNMAIAWPLYVITMVGVGHYLLLFGEGYDSLPARTVVWVMACAMLLATAAGPLDSMLLMAGKSTTSLWISLVGLALNVVLCFILVPLIGILGAAVAWSTAILVRNSLTFLSVRQTLGLNPWSRAALLVALAALLSFGLPLLPVALSGTTTLWPFLAALAIGVLVYSSLLWWWRAPLQLQAFVKLRRSVKS